MLYDGLPKVVFLAREGRLSELAELLAEGGDPNESMSDGCTPLMVAIRNWHEKCVIYLVESGANVNAETMTGATPVHYAAREGCERMLTIILGKNPNVNAQDGSGSPPLMSALRSGASPSFLRILLEHGANPDLKNKEGLCAWDIARDETTKEVLRAGRARFEARELTEHAERGVGGRTRRL